MPDINLMRRLQRRQAEEPADPATVEREVYEKLYGESRSDVTVIEVPPEPAVRAERNARPRRAPKRAAPSRAVS